METKGKANREIWKDRVEAQAASGLTHEAYCTLEGITGSAFRCWRKRLQREESGNAGFVEVSTVPHARSEHGVDFTSAVTLEIPGKVRIVVSAETDLEILTRVVAALVS